jgi:NAD-dependent deacetylase
LSTVYQQLIGLIESSHYCVALTGAGISTLSGIRDFRGKNGIYKDYDADRLFDIDYFNENPSFFYTMSKDFIYNLDEKEPNIVHKELARLEKCGKIKAVVTQNIDMLHTKAGSKNVIEIHGSPRNHTCCECGVQYGYEEIAKKVKLGTVPRCEKCSGLVKPDIVFFGEMLNPQSSQEAFTEFARADLALALGTSLVVQPAASLPLATIENGGKLVIINDMETHLDRYAALKFDDLVKSFDCIGTSTF